MEQDKIVIIQLTAQDANRVLALVQREATDGQIWNSYWENVANQIQECFFAQKDGKFFQCVACQE